MRRIDSLAAPAWRRPGSRPWSVAACAVRRRQAPALLPLGEDPNQNSISSSSMSSGSSFAAAIHSCISGMAMMCWQKAAQALSVTSTS